MINFINGEDAFCFAKATQTPIMAKIIILYDISHMLYNEIYYKYIFYITFLYFIEII